MGLDYIEVYFRYVRIVTIPVLPSVITFSFLLKQIVRIIKLRHMYPI